MKPARSYYEIALRILDGLERDEIALRGFKARRRLERVDLDGPPDQVADELAGVVSVLLDEPVPFGTDKGET